MKKNKFIKNTFYLMIGGFITKIMAMIIRIILTRKVGTEGLGLYMLILPTFGLFITLSSLGIPLAISKLVSENNHNNKKLVLSIIPLIIVFNIGLMIVLFLISPILSKYLLHNNSTLYPLMAIGLTLPFISISDIIRGYFFGKQKILPYILSNNMEQLIRLFLIMFLIPYLLNFNLEITITGVVLINIISESVSIIILLFFVPKNATITKRDFAIQKDMTKKVLDISLPTTSARLIGTVGSFLEPIVLTLALTLVGYSEKYITFNYGIINGYVLPLLLLPSFFSYAISNALLPVVSNNYTNKNYGYVRKKIKEAILVSLLIGVPVTLFFVFIPEFFLKLLYNTTLGSNYLRIIAPLFLLHYIQSPLTAVLQAMGKTKIAMYGTLIGTITRTVLLFICSLLKVGMWGLIIALLSNIFIVTIHHIYYVKKYVK